MITDRVNGTALKPVYEWLSSFERTWNARLDRLDDLLVELQSELHSNTTPTEESP
jgi:hypothetical protein